MPRQNRFQHQSYPTQPVLEPEVISLTPELPEPLPDFTRLHSEFGLTHVLPVHGTFMGSDPIGLQAMLNEMVNRASPSRQLLLRPLVNRLAVQTKRFTELLTADIANYSLEFCEEFQKLVGDDPEVTLLEPTWSSENHHLARAGLAVRLLCRIDEMQAEGFDPEHGRVMLWGHSHAGNAFALLTNLLANDRDSVDRFFTVCGDVLGDSGLRARDILASVDGPHPLARGLILVTFGTPVRYGWDVDGCRYLLHLIHHRPFDPEHPARALPALQYGCEEAGLEQNAGPVAQSILDILTARQGDWVQSFAVAGTDLPPVINREQNEALGRLLETGLAEQTPERLADRWKVACPRWQTATRMHTDGRNVLAEYAPTRVTRFGPAHQTVLGHGIYTMIEWLPRQLAVVMDWLERDGVARV